MLITYSFVYLMNIYSVSTVSDIVLATKSVIGIETDKVSTDFFLIDASILLKGYYAN